MAFTVCPACRGKGGRNTEKAGKVWSEGKDQIAAGEKKVEIRQKIIRIAGDMLKGIGILAGGGYSGCAALDSGIFAACFSDEGERGTIQRGF